jgi:hypothetical protein
MSQATLALQLVVHSGPPRPAGTIVLVNTGNTEVRIWRTGNEWGDTAFSFEVIQDDPIWRVVRQPQVYTRNLPSSVVVPAGTTHEWPFDLGDGQWQADPHIEQVLVPGAQLVAIYHVPRSPEAVTHNVWMGRLRSKPVVLED